MSDHVYGAKCTSCGAVSYPSHAVCPECSGEVFDRVPIGGVGKVLTYTDVYALAIDYETRFLRLAMVELEDGTRATGQLLADEPKLGMRIETRIGVVREPGDRKILGLQFVPV